jgi:hypothetical protein
MQVDAKASGANGASCSFVLSAFNIRRVMQDKAKWEENTMQRRQPVVVKADL